MNGKVFFVFVAIAALLAACTAEATPTPASAEEIIASIGTSAALTLIPSQPEAENVNVSLPATEPVQTIVPVPTTDALIQPSFTPTANMLYPSVDACDNAAYIDDINIPDGTVFAPGEVFTKTWRMQNNGTCTWKADYVVQNMSGDSMSGVTTAIEKTVAAGEAANISVELTAPETEGTYTGYWILANNSGTAFGNIVYVQIIVSASEKISTPTPTVTTKTVATVQPTATPIPATATPDPTLEPTIEATAEPTESSIETEP